MDSIKKAKVAPQGLIKATGGAPTNLSGEQKAQLIRRGNELFNERHYDLAERIFLTLGYSDGLVRVGDVMFKRHDYAHALKLYQKAPDPGRVARVAKRMAMVVRQWLIEAAKTDAAIQAVSTTPPASTVASEGKQGQ